MTNAFDFWATPEGDLVHPAEALQQLLEKVRRYRVNIDGNVCTVMVTTLVLEVILVGLWLYSIKEFSPFFLGFTFKGCQNYFMVH